MNKMLMALMAAMAMSAVACAAPGPEESDDVLTLSKTVSADQTDQAIEELTARAESQAVIRCLARCEVRDNGDGTVTVTTDFNGACY